MAKKTTYFDNCEKEIVLKIISFMVTVFTKKNLPHKNKSRAEVVAEPFLSGTSPQMMST